MRYFFLTLYAADRGTRRIVLNRLKIKFGDNPILDEISSWLDEDQTAEMLDLIISESAYRFVAYTDCETDGQLLAALLATMPPSCDSFTAFCADVCNSDESGTIAATISQEYLALQHAH